MKHLGDITKINGAEIEPVWCITGGSPCQDLSVAGKRAGLAGARSGLFMEQMRIVKEMRERDRATGRTDELIRPRFMVWENVPGAFSSNFRDGFGDFGAVLEETCRVAEPTFSLPRLPPKWKWTKAGCIVGDGWSVAWRTHDAQFWGVPQRRRRISLIADYNGYTAADILFERVGATVTSDSDEAVADTRTSRGQEVLAVGEGLPGHSEPSRAKGQAAPGDSANCSGTTGIGFDGYNGLLTDNVAATLGVNCGMSTGRNGIMEDAVPLENYPIDGRCKVQEDGMVQTLTSRMGTGGNNVPLLLKRCGEDQPPIRPMAVDCRNLSANDKVSGTLQAKENGGHSLNYQNPVVYGICAKDSNAMKSTNPHSGFYEAETTRCLDGNGGNPTCNQGGMAVVALEGNGSRPSHKGDGYKETDVMYTLNATEQHGVAHPTFSSSKASFFTSAEEELANTLVATDYKDPPLINDTDGLEYIVRRLTPTECARLQGFPDGWVELGEWTDTKGKKHKDADAPKYKALGNSIALPFWKWMFRRMARYLPQGATLGSLFDGIGGFPLSWVEIHGDGTARWASEIEEFPIAVTKARFGEE